MSLLQQFTDNIHEHQLLQQSDNLLLAVSGGVDSVVLCELCHRAAFTFSIAHANFQLRGKDSEADEEFVRSLADKYRVPVHVRLFETKEYAEHNKLSIQVAARELRYNWFDQLLAAGHKWLLTAHHAGDNVETMMMNFFRGTGISGLRGILPKNGNIIRPMLPFTKEEIISFAKENNLQWREDSSNSSEKYSRNYFRNTLIPLVNRIYPEAENNLKENVQRFREIEELYLQSVEMHKKKLIEHKGKEAHIPILKLKKVTPLRTIVYEIIKEYNFSSGQLHDVLQLIAGEHGKYVQSNTHRIIKNRNWLIIAEKEMLNADYIIIEKGQTEVGDGLLNIEILKNDSSISGNNFIADIDNGRIEYPLILRRWKQGDYFYPLGMPKKKKYRAS